MKNKSMVAAVSIMAVANLLFSFTLFLLIQYDKVYFDQFLYLLKTSSAGAEQDFTFWGTVSVILFAALLCGIDLALYYLLSGRFADKLKKSQAYIKFCAGKLCRFFKTHALPLALVLMVLSTSFFVVSLDVVAYVDKISTDSDFIENHYVTPTSDKLTFPEKPRNLIYIFLESMESSFADKASGGAFDENYIKELTELAKNNVNFSHSKDLGGALSYYGTTWTAGAMVSQTAGIPVKVPIEADSYGGENAYMPGVVSLGELLEQRGYRQLLLLGSDAEFAYRDSYFTEHGGYEVVDIKSLKESGRLPEEYREWWGYEDSKLFEFAKQELTSLASSGEPFNFTMLTADTHFPDGYICPECEELYESQYANVIACSSRQVSEFIDWIREQPFYENTTIIISGDHLTMDPSLVEGIDEDYTRTIYNCIINAPKEPIKASNRAFGVFDMLPTTLSALGISIEGDRLGLGTDLFSACPTLTEIYGYDYLDEQIQMNSEFYNKTFLHLEE